MAIAGHVSPRMLALYSHVRLEAKRKALDALSQRPAQAAQQGDSEGVTSQATSQNLTLPLQVIDSNGGADGTRTRDLMRDRHAF